MVTVTVPVPQIPPITTCNLDSARLVGFSQGVASVDTSGVALRAVNAYKAQIPNSISVLVHVTKDTILTVTIPKP